LQSQSARSRTDRPGHQISISANLAARRGSGLRRQRR